VPARGGPPRRTPTGSRMFGAWGVRFCREGGQSGRLTPGPRDPARDPRRPVNRSTEPTARRGGNMPGLAHFFATRPARSRNGSNRPANQPGRHGGRHAPPRRRGTTRRSHTPEYVVGVLTLAYVLIVHRPTVLKMLVGRRARLGNGHADEMLMGSASPSLHALRHPRGAGRHAEPPRRSSRRGFEFWS